MLHVRNLTWVPGMKMFFSLRYQPAPPLLSPIRRKVKRRISRAAPRACIFHNGWHNFRALESLRGPPASRLRFLKISMTEYTRSNRHSSLRLAAIRRTRVGPFDRAFSLRWSRPRYGRGKKQNDLAQRHNNNDNRVLRTEKKEKKNIERKSPSEWEEAVAEREFDNKASLEGAGEREKRERK